jgi:hypothetical protein
MQVRQTTQTRSGNSFTQAFQNCQMQWWFGHRAPLALGEPQLGAQPIHTAPPLMIGGLMHTALENYYRSGRSLQDAAQAVELAATERMEEFISLEKRDEALALVHRLLDRYDAAFKDEDLEVMTDDVGELLIEREYEIDLGYNDYVFTSRPDMVVAWQGYVGPLDYKTVAASRLHVDVANMSRGRQWTGELLAVQLAHPQWKVNGAIGRFIVKDRSAKSPLGPFSTEVTERSPHDFEKFHRDIVDVLQDIDARQELYDKKLEQGVDPFTAARQIYLENRFFCYLFRQCEYLEPCMAVGREESLMQGFRVNPRNVDG